uniref:Cadherin-like domain-containing protein n=1 Tax=Macrostomum lignano TaxID=282301 RepID=A0A1I8IRG7_9PLAT
FISLPHLLDLLRVPLWLLKHGVGSAAVTCGLVAALLEQAEHHAATTAARCPGPAVRAPRRPPGTGCCSVAPAGSTGSRSRPRLAADRPSVGEASPRWRRLAVTARPAATPARAAPHRDRWSIPDARLAGFFSVRSESVGGRAFLRLLTTRRAANSRDFSGSLAVPIRAEWGEDNRRFVDFKLQIRVLDLPSSAGCPVWLSRGGFDFFVNANEASLYSAVGRVRVSSSVPDSGDLANSHFLRLEPRSPLFALHPRSGLLILTRPAAELPNTTLLTVAMTTAVGNCHSETTVRVVAVRRAESGATLKVSAALAAGPVPDFGRAGSVYASLSLSGSAATASLTVSIVNSEAQHYFELVPSNASTGLDRRYLLQLRRDEPGFLHKREPIRVHYSVAAAGSPSRRTISGQLSVDPSDRRLLGPDAANRNFNVSAPECLPVGWPVFRFRPTLYRVSPPGLRYEFEAYAAAPELRLHPDSGVLSVARPLDAETVRSLTFVARIRDADRRTTALNFHSVRLQISDCNEFAPTVANNNSRHSVPEAAPIDSPVLTIDADDPDVSGAAGGLELTLANCNDALGSFPFALVGRQIVVTGALDSETMASEFRLFVRVTDRGSLPGRRESLGIFTVQVVPRNEHPPQFDVCGAAGGCDFRVWRRARRGTPATGALTAVDLDHPSGPPRHELLDDPTAGCFDVDQLTGRIFLTCDLANSRAARNTSTLTLVLVARDADDASLLSPRLLVRLHLSRNAQPQPSPLRPRRESDSKLAAQVAANAAARAADIARVAEQEERLAAALMPPSRPANRPPTVGVLGPGQVRVSEDAPADSRVVGFAAFDPDDSRTANGRLQFRILTGNDDFVFHLVPPQEGDAEDTGRIDLAVLRPLDRERRAFYQLRVGVCDMGKPPLCASPQEVTVEVQDANDNAPLFNLSAIAASTNTGSAFETVVVAEDSPVGAVVARFAADDPDVGNNGSVSFSLADSGGAFEIDATDGTLRTASRGLLDRELAAEHRLLVRATDAGRPQRVSELRFLVRILDRNDCTPTFVTVDGGQGHGRLTLMVDEATPPGALLTRLIAVDSDERLNGRVHYRLIGAPEATAQFSLDSRSGCLFLAAPLRRPATRSLFVEAIDSGVGREGSRSSRILLLAHSAAPPPRVPIFVVFDRPVLALTVSEAAAVGTPVGRLSVSLTPRHSEFKARQRLLFSLVDGNGLGFFGVRDDGTLVTLQPLDREAQPSGYWLTVRAQLGAVAGVSGQPGLRQAEPRISSCRVFIGLRDVNDNRPRVLAPLHRRLTVMEGAPAGRELLAEIPAEDSDDPAVGGNARIHFAIAAGNEAGTLSWTIGQVGGGTYHGQSDGRWPVTLAMDNRTGRIVTTAVPIDREVTSEFRLTVEVSDSGQPQPLTATALIEVTVQDLNDSPPRFLQRIFD